MLKTSERKAPNPPANNPCFEKSEHGPELGISFEKKDGTKRFAHYSFLSAVDSDGPEKLVFRYTFCTVIIQGRSLQALWKTVCQGSLSRVCEADSLSSCEPFINTITIADVAIPPDEPGFPEKAI